MYCPIIHLEGLMNEARDKQKNTIQEAAREDLSLSMLETILRYKDNLKDPAVQKELREHMENHNKAIMDAELRNTNEKILSTSHLEKSVADFQRKMEEHLKKDRNYSFGDPGSLQMSVLEFLNKNYKWSILGPAMGRIIMEYIQAWVVTFTSKMDEIINYKLPPWLTIPNVGNLNKDLKYKSREFEWDEALFGKNLLRSEQWKLARLFNKPTDFLMELQSGIMNKTVGTLENFLYHSVFNIKYIEKAMELEWYTWPVSEFKPTSRTNFLFTKGNITPQNAIRKKEIYNEIERKSKAESSKLFFDYTENPLLVQKMEQLVPFTNYMYSGVRMLSRYPKSMMFTAVMLNNMLTAFWEETTYLDDEWEKVDAGLSYRFAGLASVGLGWVWLNLQRFMQFSPASTGVNPIPLYSFLTNREDFRFKKFYQTWSMDDLIDVGLTTFGGTLWRLFKWARNLNDPYEKWSNPVKDIMEPLAYMLTGMPIKDKTQQTAWQKLIVEQDFDYLLSLSDIQLNQFFKHPTNAEKWWDKKALLAAKAAKDIWLLWWEDNLKGQRALLTAITWMGIQSSTFDPTEYKDVTDMMENLLEITVWPAFDKYGSAWWFDTFLSKAEAFTKDKNFKHFEKYNKKLYEIYKEYGELAPWYREQSAARKLQENADTRLEWTAKAFALKYRFEWDEWMNISEKTSKILSGQLKDVLMVPEKNPYWLPAGPAMTDEYLRSLDRKGPMVKNYLDQANKVIALEKARNLFYQMAYAQTSKTGKDRYFALAKNISAQEKIAFENFKRTWTPEYELYMLTDKWLSVKERIQKWEEYIQNSYRQKAQATASKFDRLVATSKREKEALSVTLDLNVDEKTIQLAKQMVSDINNPHYYQYTKNPEKLSSIINSIQ